MSEQKKEEEKKKYDFGISVSSSGIRNKLNEFKQQMDKMNTILNEIKGSTSNVHGSWQGDQSDKILGEINEFQSTFDDITAQNKKYEAFLNSVIEKYSTSDYRSTRDVEDNLKAYSINT
mgnify:CR=1 FL=1